jgi:hypothetical protein
LKTSHFGPFKKIRENISKDNISNSPLTIFMAMPVGKYHKKTELRRHSGNYAKAKNIFKVPF